jgi:hypothetical protein
MTVAKVIEISKKPSEKKKGSKKLEQNGKIVEYRVNLQVTFILESKKVVTKKVETKKIETKKK